MEDETLMLLLDCFEKLTLLAEQAQFLQYVFGEKPSLSLPYHAGYTCEQTMNKAAYQSLATKGLPQWKTKS